MACGLGFGMGGIVDLGPLVMVHASESGLFLRRAQHHTNNDIIRSPKHPKTVATAMWVLRAVPGSGEFGGVVPDVGRLDGVKPDSNGT